MTKRVISIHTNADSLAALLGEMARVQFPYAVANALTSMAFLAQRSAKGEVARDFHLRNRYTSTGIQVNKADKSEWPNPSSEVGIEKGRSYLIDHVLSGTRRGGRFGRAIPVAPGLRGANGRIAKRNKPGALIKLGQRKGAGGRRPGSKNGQQGAALPFIIKVGKGFSNEVLVRRQGRDRYPLEILYGFKRNVRVKREFELDVIVARSVGGAYYPTLTNALKRALATAKPKAERGASLSAGKVIDSGR